VLVEEEIMTVEVFSYIIRILASLLSIIYFIYKMKGRNNRSLDNIKKRFEIYEKIIMNVDNKVLSYTYLRDYLGCPISDDMIEYILKSTHFYDFVTNWKNIYTLGIFDPEAKKKKDKNKIKKQLQLKRTVFAFFYFIFLLPFLFVLIDPTEKLISSGYFIPLFLISLPFAIVAIFSFAIECGNMTEAIRLMEMVEKEEEM
jgi:hypothetical protein